jgi:hypothetical protein
MAGSHEQFKAPARKTQSLKGLPHAVALILRSIRSTRVSRFLLRFSNSRTFLSSSAERSSSFSETSATVNAS